MKRERGFASDNNAGVHPRIMQALADANQGHVVAYGDDKYTNAAVEKFKALFGNACEVFFVFNGTGANVLGINQLGLSFHSVICPATAHINCDECGAPGKFSGMKLIPVDTPDGKLTVELIAPHLHDFGFEHHAQPGIVSITQPTEMGTLYTCDEVKKIASLVHHYGLKLHMDGARISNAVAALEVDVCAFTRDAGVDVLSFGGTKNGMMYGEAVVFFDRDLSANFKYYRKQATQLTSKMRYIGAQFSAFLTDDLWIENARHSNHMAQLLAEKVKHIPEIQITQKVQANGVFAILPKEIIAWLKEEYFFYDWDENKGEVRWMCSFDTTEGDINGFVELLKSKIIEL
jgi:threonine aldolase